MTATKFPQWDEEILDLYKNYGFSMREIGDMIHWSEGFVHNRLSAMQERGLVTIKRKGGSNRCLNVEKLRLAERLYLEEKKSTREVAEVMGVHPGTILHWLRRMGTPMRNSKYSTHCVKGHEFSPDNTAVIGGKRRCLRCKRESNRLRAARRRAAARELVAG